MSLEDAIDKKPAELSGGMKKRIGLARTIITEPRLILYDEPTTGLDPITTKEISQLIVDLQQDLNVTAIIVTHDIICANISGTEQLLLTTAKIIVTEEILKKLESSNDEFLKEFFSGELIQN